MVVFFLEEVQDKLLTEYEQELKTTTTRHAKKDSSASDDWEKVLIVSYILSNMSGPKHEKWSKYRGYRGVV